MAHYYSSSSATPQPSYPSLVQSLDMADYSSSFVPASIGAPPQPQPFRFENLNASSPAGAQPTRTLQLIDRFEEQGVAASRNQQNVPFANENNIGQLGLGLRDDYWTYKKTLTRSDGSRGQCRLLLEKSFVEEHILPDIIDAGQCRSANGIPIAVWDADKSRGFHLILKQRPSNDSYVLNGNWNNFVDEAGLKEGDKVGFTYTGSTLFFKRLN